MLQYSLTHSVCQLAGLTYWKRFDKPLHEIEWEEAEAKRQAMLQEAEKPVMVGPESTDNLNGDVDHKVPLSDKDDFRDRLPTTGKPSSFTLALNFK